MKLKLSTKKIASVVIVILLLAGIYLFFFSKPIYTPLKQTENHIRGAQDAKVTIVEYSDFQCPFCARVQPTLDQILTDYEGKVKIQYRHFLLHSLSQKAAEASECAGDQEKFWEYHDKLFEKQSEWSTVGTGEFIRYAKDIGLDVGLFTTCLDSRYFASKVRAEWDEGKRKGVTGTPTFFVNGKPIVGAQPYTTFQTAIESALKTQ